MTIVTTSGCHLLTAAPVFERGRARFQRSSSHDVNRLGLSIRPSVSQIRNICGYHCIKHSFYDSDTESNYY
jgi:hypothetical protein